MINCNKQRGVVLITVIFIVAVVAIIAVNLMSDVVKQVRRTQYNQIQGQGMNYLYGVESWAIARLMQDRNNDKNNGAIDYAGEIWNSKIELAVIQNKVNINANMHDVQAKFNLNNLAQLDAGSSSKTAYYQAQVQYLQRMLSTLEIDTKLANAIIDWLDSDTVVRLPGGAEDSTYLSKPIPYRTANTAFSSLLELKLVNGVTPEIFEKLKDHLTVLPQTTPINVNTADAIVLRSLSPLLNSDMIDSIIERRTKKPFKTTKEFMDYVLAMSKQKTIQPKELGQLISVSTRYFECQSNVIMPKGVFNFRSIIKRDADKISVVARVRGLN